MDKVLQVKIENSERKILKAEHAIQEQEKIISDETANIKLYQKQNKEIEKSAKKEN